MRLTAFCLLAFFCLNVAVYAQSPLPRLSLTFTNAPLKTVLDTIESRVHFAAFGPSSWGKLAKNVTISVENEALDRILELCFKNQPLNYQVIANTISITIKNKPDFSVGGKIINGRKEPVAGATIQIKGTKTFVQSNENGEFKVPIDGASATLVIGSINYERRELTISAGRDTVIQLQGRITALSSVSVLHTGYQSIPRERATGSFTFIDNSLVNRNPNPNILQRLDGVASSTVFTKNAVFGTKQSTFSIRGRSTIFANPEPLIVVDNFPYTGDIYNINPDDVDNVTILKDAAAASIWGAFSGNGVVVITTKKGKFNQGPRVCVNTSITTGWKPDLYYDQILAPSEVVDLQQYLFGQGYYDQFASDPSHPLIPPVAEILYQVPGRLTPAEAANEINVLKTQDTRHDLGHYLYRHELTQQYDISLSGGGASNIYYFSAGYERDLPSLVRNTYDRVTLTGKSTYILIPNRLEFSSGFNYAAGRTANNNSGYTPSYDYTTLADASGHALAVPYLYRQSFIDTVGGGQLLDWHYRPLDELRNSDNTTRLSDYRINADLKYNLLKDLSANLYYQYWKAGSDMQNYHSLQTYFARDLINNYTQPNSTPMYPIPRSGILDETDSSYQANNARLQLNYDHYFSPERSITAIAGVEVRDIEGTVKTTRLYGYDKDLNSGMQLNNLIAYPLYLTPYIQQQIPQINHDLGTSDRYLSYYINGSYHLFGKYIFSASARKDESNIFGVKANQKGVPLWSAGVDWEISREGFYHADTWLPYLKLRLTDGYNGNVDKSVSAFTTAQSSPNNSYGTPVLSINNPPNPYLQWEKIHIVNVGLDFATAKNTLEGSLEYFVKYGEELIGPSTLDPTTGNFELTGNAAAMTTHGIDFTLRTKKQFGAVCWSATLLFSYAQDRVTKYDTATAQKTIDSYFSQAFFNPLQGHPLYSVYALKWMGLDSLTGDPQGWLNGHISKDYLSLTTSSDFSNLIYMGPENPLYFGSFRNAFDWKSFSFSFNITYKFGYVFRRTSIDYFDLFTGASAGHPDYNKRWMKRGDERITNVPSQVFPPDRTRDIFYANSQVLIEKGDHIRLQDIRVSYNLKMSHVQKLKVRSVQVYSYASNLAILWRANHQGIDPDAIPQGSNIVFPNPTSLTIGIKVGF